jgi:hypothetical protein
MREETIEPRRDVNLSVAFCFPAEPTGVDMGEGDEMLEYVVVVGPK